MSVVIVERKNALGRGGESSPCYRYVEVEKASKDAELAPEGATPCDWQVGEPPTMEEG